MRITCPDVAVDSMFLSTRIWLLPIGMGIALALSLLFNLALGIHSAAHLETLRSVDNPFLECMLRVNDTINDVRTAFQAAVSEGDLAKMREARQDTDAVREALLRLRALPGRVHSVEALSAAFESYQAEATGVAQALLAGHASQARVPQMQAAQKILNDRSAAMISDARSALERRFSQVAQAQRLSRWASALTSLLVLAVLAVSSRLIIHSVWRELQKSHHQLLDAARVAGMAEIATNVLHNVGNVLNSVNVSADLIATRLRRSKVAGLGRAVDLLDRHAHDIGPWLDADPRGKALPGYLRELSRTLEAEHAQTVLELHSLGKSIDHVKEIIATQQSYAGSSRVVAAVKLEDLFEDALRMNVDTGSRHEIIRADDIAAIPKLALDQHRLLQILVNLISNAKHALVGVTDRTPHITLGATLARVDGRQNLRITVTDNGEGIAQEHLARVFSHGFTTRKDGHGFGLHSCVLAAQEMGGGLSVHSDGPGRGATFTLDIPADTSKG